MLEYLILSLGQAVYILDDLRHIALIDIEKAYDNVTVFNLLKVMEEINIRPKLIYAIWKYLKIMRPE